MQDELLLLERIQKKDMEAFEALYERLKGNVFSLAYQMLKSKEDSEEVLQDTFTKVFNKAESYSSARGSVRAFIYTIARNECISRLRKQKVRPQSSDIDPSLLGQSAEPSGHPAQRIEANLALEVLAEDERQLIQKAFFYGYSHSEIATNTGLPLGTVKTKLRKALKRMKNQLES